MANDGDVDPDIERQGISYFQACQYIDDLKYFMLCQKNPSDEHFSSLGRIEDWIHIIRAQNQVQKRITDYFQPGSQGSAVSILNESKFQARKTRMISVEAFDKEIMRNDF